jgi:hypothetical protein
MHQPRSSSVAAATTQPRTNGVQLSVLHAAASCLVAALIAAVFSFFVAAGSLSFHRAAP